MYFNPGIAGLGVPFQFDRRAKMQTETRSLSTGPKVNYCAHGRLFGNDAYRPRRTYTGHTPFVILTSYIWKLTSGPSMYFNPGSWACPNVAEDVWTYRGKFADAPRPAMPGLKYILGPEVSFHM
jgi:hypothetical protein